MHGKAPGRLGEMKSFRRRLGGALLASCLLAGLLAPSAGALTPYQPQDVLLPSGFFFPTGLAVDQETGDIYAGGFNGSGQIHRYEGGTDVETAFGEGNYESVAVDPVKHLVYGLTKPP